MSNTCILALSSLGTNKKKHCQEISDDWPFLKHGLHWLTLFTHVSQTQVSFLKTLTLVYIHVYMYYCMYKEQQANDPFCINVIVWKPWKLIIYTIHYVHVPYNFMVTNKNICWCISTEIKLCNHILHMLGRLPTPNSVADLHGQYLKDQRQPHKNST